MSIKLKWQDRAAETEEYHCTKIKANPKHTIRDTAKELNRSYGSVNEDLQLASWLKTHPRLEVIKRLQDALEFMRDKRKSLRLRGR